MARTSGGLIKRSYVVREDQQRWLTEQGRRLDPPSESAALRRAIDVAMQAEQQAAPSTSTFGRR